MGKLTGAIHGDAANDLLAFYSDKVNELEDSGQYFMAAIALGFALETAILTYFLVEFGDDNDEELEVPDTVGMKDLFEAAIVNVPIPVSLYIQIKATHCQNVSILRGLPNPRSPVCLGCSTCETCTNGQSISGRPVAGRFPRASQSSRRSTRRCGRDGSPRKAGTVTSNLHTQLQHGCNEST